jgi:hypothetical protein
MKLLVVAFYLGAIASGSRQPAGIDYAALWEAATPFPTFLENVKAREEQWRSRFANAAIDAGALNDARLLPGRRRILAVAEDRCSDSAWALPYLGKLAAAVPERIELRVISARKGQSIQAAHPTPDGRKATPTIVVLDEQSRFLGAWVERPAELQAHYQEKETDDQPSGSLRVRERLVYKGRRAHDDSRDPLHHAARARGGEVKRCTD